jgi:hypothetical protein
MVLGGDCAHSFSNLESAMASFSAREGSQVCSAMGQSLYVND